LKQDNNQQSRDIMAGYNGYSKSNNAVEAEERGCYPLTRATAVLADASRITRAEARRILVAIGPVEWHHTSKMYNATKYYDARNVADVLSRATDKSFDGYTTQIEVDEENSSRTISLKIEMQKSCTHTPVAVYRDRSKREGGGKVLSHHKCLICGASPINL
jgi:hypothetical protein